MLTRILKYSLPSTALHTYSFYIYACFAHVYFNKLPAVYLMERGILWQKARGAYCSYTQQIFRFTEYCKLQILPDFRDSVTRILF